MADFDYLFIHPLLNNQGDWSGFLIESGHGNAANESLQYLFQHTELAHFNQRQPWFFPLPQSPATLTLPPNFLLQQGVATFPADSPDNIDTEQLRDFETQLRQNHHKVALRTTTQQKLPDTGTWDYLLMSINQARCQPPFGLLGLSTRSNLIATDVHSHAEYEWASNNACTLSTSEFLQNRSSQGKTADLTRLKLLELLSLIVADADTAEIEDIFRQEPKLAYCLLRLVNSAANAPRQPITCFSQAINLLGRRQLQRWLQLLVFAEINNGQHANPLLQKAAIRGRQMELLASSLGPIENNEHFLDAAFMVGAFSLLDVLLNMTIREVLEHLPLPIIVNDALAEHTGILGELLKAVAAAENRNLGKARQQLQKLGVAPQKHIDAQLIALNWAAKTHPPS